MKVIIYPFFFVNKNAAHAGGMKTTLAEITFRFDS